MVRSTQQTKKSSSFQLWENKVNKLIEQSLKLEDEDNQALKDRIRRQKHRDEFIFAENIGAVEIFSMAEVARKHEHAFRVYGDERVRYARNLLEDIAKDGNRRQLAHGPSHEQLASLRNHYPNFSQVVDQIECAVALSKLSLSPYFYLPPLLIVGHPGIGKTAFCQAFAATLGTSFKRLDVGGLSSSTVINGLDLGWSTGHVGEVLKLLIESEYANPVLMLDEVDKIQGLKGVPIEPVLLSLLERESARTFRDEALLLPINSSMMNIIATANNLDFMSEPLKSRFTVVEISKPTHEESLAIVQFMYEKMLRTNTWGRHFQSVLDDKVKEGLVHLPPRKIQAELLYACGKAARKGRHEILLEDIPEPKNHQQKNKIGFVG